MALVTVAVSPYVRTYVQKFCGIHVTFTTRLPYSVLSLYKFWICSYRQFLFSTGNRYVYVGIFQCFWQRQYSTST
jgi:hypothetical protein